MIAAASRRRCLEVKPCRSQSPGDQGAVPFQVVLVDISIAMPRAVVLVDPPSPVDPQVDTGDEAGPARRRSPVAGSPESQPPGAALA